MAVEKSRTTLVAPSLLSCDFARLADEIGAVETAGADWLHVDVMDGMFVDNITIGPPVVKCIKKAAKIPLDVHLMIEKPERYIEAFVKAGADVLTIHVEATSDAAGTLKRIRQLGAKPGITLRPATKLDRIADLFELVDLVLIMTVNPGWGGQAFMEDQLSKVKEVKAWSANHNPKLHIEVDGGVNGETSKRCVNAGANVLVAGNAVFKAPDYAAAIGALKV